MPRIMRQTPARIYHDCRGNRIYAERTYDCQWRFEIPLNELPPHVITTLLAVEDRKFYRHGGVNYMAGTPRAVPEPGRRQDHFWRVHDHHAARGNGGTGQETDSFAQIHADTAGTEAGTPLLQGKNPGRIHQPHSIRREILRFRSRRELLFFGLPASKLNLAEASLLCGLPQKPNRFRPGTFLTNARSRQRLVLQALVHHNILDTGEAKRIYDSEPLRLRDFTRPSPFRQLSQAPYIHYCRGCAEAGGGSVIHTALDPELERMVRNVLIRRRDSLEGVHDAAAVLIDNATGEIRVMIGTLEFHASGRRAGQCRAGIPFRGSALKPFLYAEAAGGGILIAETVLDDSPLRYGDYAPGNYDASYMGRVSASTALSHSLNTPVIRLLARLGTERVNTLFRRLHLPPGKSDTGLPFALGTVGYDLLSLTAAYTVFPCGGKFRNPGFLLRGAHAEPEAQVFPPGAAFMVAEMLRQLP
ncbi:MAG: transglycosylase domain-containing protein [Victivallales bacterium]